jgi:hypothetical protein|tara:strand:- start:48 stop:245 length:198 start_codon:yes stop_codon:yes gene_type:complete
MPQPKALKKYWAEKNKLMGNQMINQCSYHKTWYNGVPGACPKCMAKTMKDEKKRIRIESNDKYFH